MQPPPSYAAPLPAFDGLTDSRRMPGAWIEDHLVPLLEGKDSESPDAQTFSSDKEYSPTAVEDFPTGAEDSPTAVEDFPTGA